MHFLRLPPLRPKPLLLAIATLLIPLPLLADDPAAPTNAASVYKAAFTAMPELLDEEKAIFSTIGQQAARDGKALDKQKARAIVEKYASSLADVERALLIPHCDWELDYTKGPGLPLPHLSKALEAAKVLTLRASLHLVEKAPTQAAEDQSRILQLSRHVAQNDPLILTALVQIAVENLALSTIAANFSQYDNSALEALQATLSSLPPRMSMRQAIVEDNANMLSWFRGRSDSFEKQLRAAKDSNDSQRRPTIGEVLGSVAAMLASPIKTPQQFKIATDGFEKDARHLKTLLALPYPEANTQVNGFCQRFAASQSDEALLSALIFPSFVNVLSREMRITVYSSMLRAAIAIRLNGAEALSTINDPLTGKPFDYKALDNGFELISREQIDEKPVALFFR